MFCLSFWWVSHADAFRLDDIEIYKQKLSYMCNDTLVKLVRPVWVSNALIKPPSCCNYQPHLHISLITQFYSEHKTLNKDKTVLYFLTGHYHFSLCEIFLTAMNLIINDSYCWMLKQHALFLKQIRPKVCNLFLIKFSHVYHALSNGISLEFAECTKNYARLL